MNVGITKSDLKGKLEKYRNEMQEIDVDLIEDYLSDENMFPSKEGPCRMGRPDIAKAILNLYELDTDKKKFWYLGDEYKSAKCEISDTDRAFVKATAKGNFEEASKILANNQ